LAQTYPLLLAGLGLAIASFVLVRLLIDWQRARADAADRTGRHRPPPSDPASPRARCPRSGLAACGKHITIPIVSSPGFHHAHRDLRSEPTPPVATTRVPAAAARPADAPPRPGARTVGARHHRRLIQPPEPARNTTNTPLDNLRFGHELRELVTATAAELTAIEPADATRTWLRGGWNRVQLLGHLVDSALNTIQRVVRLQAGDVADLPPYDQAAWVRHQHHRDAHWWRLIALWNALNQHVAHLIEHLPSEALTHRWQNGPGAATLEFLIQDYREHLEHHLAQLTAAVAPREADETG